MSHPDHRVKLLHGPYHTPRCKIGRALRCAIKGKVIVRGLTDGRIQWPYTWRNHINRQQSLILCADLIRAVKCESGVAIKHWWGVGDYCVWQWRKALGVDRVDEGTSDLFRRNVPDSIQSDETRSKMPEILKSPERAAKIAAAKRGVPRPPEVIEKLRQANLGRKHTEEARRNMSEGQKRREAWPPAAGEPWTAEEDALLGTMKDRDIAARTGRTESAVSDRRYSLGVTAFVRRAPHAPPVDWTPARDRLLGTMPDTNLAHKLGCSPMQVLYRRRRLGVAAFESERNKR